MNDRDEAAKRIRAGNFIRNNRLVIQTINVVHTKFIALEDVMYALPNIAKDEILDSVNFLFEAGYIHLRHIKTEEPSRYGLAGVDYRDLEGKLADKGIRLAAYAITDPLVKV